MFGREARAATLTTYQIRRYQLPHPACRRGGHRHHQSRDLGPPPYGHPRRPLGLARHSCPASPTACGRIPPARASSNTASSRLAVRAHLPAPWQDILDLAYYSGWRKNEIRSLTWDEIDEAGGVIRLSPARSKTLVGRILPISHPIAEALARRQARRDPDSPLVFHRDGIPIRRWRPACRPASSTSAAAPPPAGPRRQTPRHVASILDAARELEIRDAQGAEHART